MTSNVPMQDPCVALPTFFVSFFDGGSFVFFAMPSGAVILLGGPSSSDSDTSDSCSQLFKEE